VSAAVGKALAVGAVWAATEVAGAVAAAIGAVVGCWRDERPLTPAIGFTDMRDPGSREVPLV
jgi:hypothetical protein